jgi:hypothetical protein
MIRRRFRLYSYHTFLVIPFIVLFLYGNNMGQTSPEMTYRTLIAGTAVSVALFGLVYLFIRSRLKTGVFVTIILFALFQYGVIYEFFERLYYQGSWPFSNIHRYLLTAYLVVFIALFLFIWKSSRDFIRINYFLNILIFILIIYNLIRINNNQLLENHVRPEIPETPDSIQFNANQRPDIYYIILDGYASGNVLQKYFGFNNSEFTSRLKALNFFIADSAFSNYYYTSNSLCATLNMRYPEPSESTASLLKNNAVFETFKNNGYRIYHLYSGYAVTSSFPAADSTIYINGPNEFEKSLLKYTILRLDDLIGLFAHQRLKSQFAKMMDMAAIRATPKFCFLHFVAPHPPYIFHRDGRIRTRHRFAESSWEPREFYIDQLVYVNRQITKLLHRILSVNPNSVIILQSDHGPWIASPEKEQVFEARSHILYAVHNGNFRVPRGTSSVNTFRHLFNNLFNTGLPLLPDKFAGKELLLNDPIFLKRVRK